MTTVFINILSDSLIVDGRRLSFSLCKRATPPGVYLDKMNELYSTISELNYDSADATNNYIKLQSDPESALSFDTSYSALMALIIDPSNTGPRTDHSVGVWVQQYEDRPNFPASDAQLQGIESIIGYYIYYTDPEYTINPAPGYGIYANVDYNIDIVYTFGGDFGSGFVGSYLTIIINDIAFPITQWNIMTIDEPTTPDLNNADDHNTYDATLAELNREIITGKNVFLAKNIEYTGVFYKADLQTINANISNALILIARGIPTTITLRDADNNLITLSEADAEGVLTLVTGRAASAESQQNAYSLDVINAIVYLDPPDNTEIDYGASVENLELITIDYT